MRWLLGCFFPGWLRARAAERTRVGTRALEEEQYEDAVRALGGAVRDLEATDLRADPLALLVPLSGWSIALGMLRRCQEAMAVAERTLQLAERAYPDDTPQMRAALSNLAQLLEDGGELRDAIVVQERLVRCTDDPEREHHYFRSLCEDAGDYERLAAHAEADVQSAPTSFASWSRLGMARFRLGHLDEAAKAFDQAWQLSFDSYRGGGDWHCARNLAQLEVARERWDDVHLWLARAEALVVRMLEGQPMPPGVLELLVETRAGLHLGTGDVAEARAALEAVPSPEGAGRQRLALLRAEVDWREGNREQAAHEANEVLQWYVNRGVPDHECARQARRYLGS